MNKLIYITIMSMFLLIYFTINAKADLPTNIFEAGDTINVYIYCIEINNSVCSSSTSCEITSFYPNTSLLISQGKMSYDPTQTGFYNYSFGTLDIEGVYSSLVYCNNTDEGVTSFDFVVGDLDDTYDKTFWFYVAIYLIAVILIIVSKLTEDKYFAMFAGIILVCFGVYLSTNGLPYFDNIAIERALWLITLGTGLYFMIDNAIKLAEEGWK